MKRRLGALLLALPLILGGCRGGGLVFKGFHEDQDRALLERLAERYPNMEFRCTGQTEGAIHSVSAADGTVFPVWTAPGSRGSFQVIAYYLEEWLAAKGFYDDLEDKMAELGFSWEYGQYNHYSRHFQYEFGDLDGHGRLEQAAEAVSWTKERFDTLFQEFQKSTGCDDSLSFTLSGNFAVDGQEHLARFYLSPPGDNIIWKRDYDYDDYFKYLQQYLEDIQSGEEQKVPDME